MLSILIDLASLHPPPRDGDVIHGQVFKPGSLLLTPKSHTFSVTTAVLPGPQRGWRFLLLICRGLSTAPAGWWGIRYAWTFLRDLLLDGETLWVGGVPWTAEKRFMVTEVLLAILWVKSDPSTRVQQSIINRTCISVLPRPTCVTSLQTVSCPAGRFFNRLCSLVLRNTIRILKYTPGATIVRLLTTNVLIAYLTSWVLYLSGASEDPRMLLPAWVSICTVSV